MTKFLNSAVFQIANVKKSAHSKPARAVPLQKRIFISLIICILTSFLCYVRLAWVDMHAADFTWSLRGAERLLAGESPYYDPIYSSDKSYPYDKPLFYPLPALIVAMPFTFLSENLAGALFFGISSGLLAFGLTRDGYWRLPLFLSAPYGVALLSAQWSPLISAAALLSPLLPLVLAKPNIGLPVLLAYGTRRGLVISVLLVGATLVVWPTWPLEWRTTVGRVGEDIRFVPLFGFFGPVLALAVLRWREPSARLLLLMSLVPQRPFYDQLGLSLVCRTQRETVVLSLLSWIGAWCFLLIPANNLRWINLCLYLPALVILLRPVVPNVQVWWESRFSKA